MVPTSCCDGQSSLKFEENLKPCEIKSFMYPQQRIMNYKTGVVVEQVIRPTGLLDPIIEIDQFKQIDDLIEEIQVRAEIDERVLVTTLTKRMAEELAKYLTKSQYSLPLYPLRGSRHFGTNRNHARFAKRNF
jgi:excinuclease UvrABC helicase subunit UvrB